MRLTTFLSVFIIARVYGQTDFPGCFNYELTRSDTWLSELIEIQRQDMGLSHLPTSAEMMELAKLHLQDLNMWYDVETDYCKEYLVWSGNPTPLRTWTACCHNSRDQECLRSKGREILQRGDNGPYPVYASTMRYHKPIHTRDEMWHMLTKNPLYMEPLWKNGSFANIDVKQMGVATFNDWAVIYTSDDATYDDCAVITTPSPYMPPPNLYPNNTKQVCVTACDMPEDHSVDINNLAKQAQVQSKRQLGIKQKRNIGNKGPSRPTAKP